MIYSKKRRGRGRERERILTNATDTDSFKHVATSRMQRIEVP